jgi:ubiquitin carboxyl-terminal hydrolase 25
LKEVEDQIRDAYHCMRQHTYNLHAILIHQGSGEHGHYYAFIFDRKAQKWYRFNDFKVSEETEARVMDESFGDAASKTSAYGLIYIN